MGLVLPQANSPLGLAGGVSVTVSQAWFRAFMSWVQAIPPSATVMAFKGATAPQGWTQDTTVGLPSLPAGYMWIQKL